MINKINVTLVSPFPPPIGGIAQWASRYVSICNSFNINCSHVNTAFKGQIIFGNKKKLSFFKQYKRSKRIWNDVKGSISSNKSQIIHICIPGAPLSILRELKTVKIAKQMGVKTIIHFRSDISKSLLSLFSKFMLKKILKICDGAILLNKQSLEFAQKYNKKCKIIVIPNFILDCDYATSFDVKDCIKNIIYVGGVVEEKGCNLIINYAAKHKEYHFNLVGSSSNEMKEKINNLSNITLYENQSKDEVIKLLRKSDIFLFLSKYKKEGFSNAVIEAMSNGLPCVVTKWASNEFQIGKYSDSLSINIDDEIELENAINSLESKEKRSEVSKYNLERSKIFSSSVVMKQYYNFYMDLIKND